MHTVQPRLSCLALTCSMPLNIAVPTVHMHAKAEGRATATALQQGQPNTCWPQTCLPHRVQWPTASHSKQGFCEDETWEDRHVCATASQQGPKQAMHQAQLHSSHWYLQESRDLLLADISVSPEREREILQVLRLLQATLRVCTWPYSRLKVVQARCGR